MHRLQSYCRSESCSNNLIVIPIITAPAIVLQPSFRRIIIRCLLMVPADFPAIQKMWMFYVYDMGRECGFNKDWECPTDPDFVADDISPYFEGQTRKAYLVKVDDELAGFVLLNQAATQPDLQWNLSEWYVGDIENTQGKQND